MRTVGRPQARKFWLFSFAPTVDTVAIAANYRDCLVTDLPEGFFRFLKQGVGRANIVQHNDPFTCWTYFFQFHPCKRNQLGRLGRWTADQFDESLLFLWKGNYEIHLMLNRAARDADIRHIRHIVSIEKLSNDFE